MQESPYDEGGLLPKFRFWKESFSKNYTLLHQVSAFSLIVEAKTNNKKKESK